MRFLVAALAAALILVVPSVATAACPGADPCPYSAAGVIGQRAEGVLRFPQASAVGPDGSIYVGDQLSHTVQVFGPDGSFRREMVPLTNPMKSSLSSDSYLAKSDGQSIAGRVPVRSSNVSFAIRVPPSRLFWPVGSQVPGLPFAAARAQPVC